MSRAYRISIKESLSRHVQVDDGVCSQLELLPILSKERMRELLGAELSEKGFVREGDTASRKEGDGITTTVDLITGEVNVTAGSGDAAVRVATLKPGDVFGEASSLANKPAGATLTAHNRVGTLMLPRAELEKLLASNPKVRDYLSSLAEDRIHATNAAMTATEIVDANDLVIS